MKWPFAEWFRRRASERRARQRAIDVEILWPAIWERSGGDPVDFIPAAWWHAANSDAWRCADEWYRTEQDPEVWAARRRSAEKEAKP